MFHISKYLYEDPKSNCISKYLQDFNLKYKDSYEELINIKAPPFLAYHIVIYLNKNVLIFSWNCAQLDVN